MYVPEPVAKNRRSRKQKVENKPLHIVTNEKVVPTPTIPVAQLSGGAQKAPIIVTNPIKQKAGDPMPVLSSTSVVGGSTKAVNNKPVLVSSNVVGGTNKAVNNKQVINVPIVKKTPSLPYNEHPETPSPVKKVELPKQVKIIPTKKPIIQTRKAPEPKKVQIQPMKNRPNKTYKNKFTAKKITIQMENSTKVRKTRDAVRRNVANMTLPDITKKLRERGLIRETANPPESIQRSMMIDILLFPAPM